MIWTNSQLSVPLCYMSQVQSITLSIFLYGILATRTRQDVGNYNVQPSPRSKPLTARWSPVLDVTPHSACGEGKDNSIAVLKVDVGPRVAYEGDLLDFIASRSITDVPNPFSQHAWLTKGVIQWINENQAQYQLPCFSYSKEVSCSLLPFAIKNTCQKHLSVPFLHDSHLCWL